MQSRLIIQAEAVSDALALEYVCAVIRGGKVSETAGKKHYCHATTFNGGISVYCVPNKRSVRFIVRKNP